MEAQAEVSQTNGEVQEKEVEVLVYWKHDLQQMLGDEIVKLSNKLSMKQFGNRLAEVFKTRIDAEQGKYLLIRKFNSKFNRFVTMKMDETGFLVDSSVFDVSPFKSAMCQGERIALYEIPRASKGTSHFETAVSETFAVNVCAKSKEDLLPLVEENFKEAGSGMSSPSALQIALSPRESPKKHSINSADPMSMESLYPQCSFPSMVSSQTKCPKSPRVSSNMSLMDHPLIANLFSGSSGIDSRVGENAPLFEKQVQSCQKFQKPSSRSAFSPSLSKWRSKRGRSPVLKKNPSTIVTRESRRAFSPDIKRNSSTVVSKRNSATVRLGKGSLPTKLLDRMKAENYGDSRRLGSERYGVLQGRRYGSKRKHSPFEPSKQQKRSHYEKFLDRNASPSSSKESGELSREPSPVQRKSGLLKQNQKKEVVSQFNVHQPLDPVKPSLSGRIPLLPTPPVEMMIRPKQPFVLPVEPAAFVYGRPMPSTTPKFFIPPSVKTRSFHGNGPTIPHQVPRSQLFNHGNWNA